MHPLGYGTTFAGVFLFSQPARMARPVAQLTSGKQELIGTIEQPNLHIQCPDGGEGGSLGLPFTHKENSAGEGRRGMRGGGMLHG